VNPYFGGRFEENVAKYGLGLRLAAIASMNLTPHELDACFSDPAKGDIAIASFQQAARLALEQGAEVIVPAGGRIAAFLNSHGVREVDGALILDGTAALITQAEASVRLHAVMGSTVSRRRLYARASQELTASAAAEYGERYNMPALRRLASEDSGTDTPARD
jgi:hypothetical protein